MSDTEQLPDDQDVDLDDYAHQACYVFKPVTDDLNARPKKRRKTTHNSHESSETLPLLCNGTESFVCARARHETLQRSWNQQQLRIDETISQLDNDALKNIIEFVEEDGQHRTEGRLQAGLVVSGSDISVQARLLDQWRTIRTSSTELVSQLRSSSCPNLQTALKYIIKSTITEAIGQDGYQEFFSKHKRLIPMNFDLELLQIFAKEQDVSKVIVSLLDVETFETNTLAELILTLASWSDRIPFVVLLGIATTVELFERRLPRSITSLLEARIFTLPSSADLLYNIFSGMQTADDSVLFFGPATISMLYDLSQNQSTTVENFTKVLKCAYMSHFFANPLSALASDAVLKASEATILCEAIRNTRSFQKHCEQLLEKGTQSVPVIRDLLDNDKKLLDAAMSAKLAGRNVLRNAFQAVVAVGDLRQQVAPNITESVFQTELKLCGHLNDLTASEVYEDTVASLEKLKSSDLLDALLALKSITQHILETAEIVSKIRQLHESEGLQSIRSSHDISTFTSSVTTTSSPSKKKAVPASKSIPSLTPAQKKYTTIIDSFITQVTDKIHACSIDISNTFLHEAFVYNNRQPLQNSFTPRPRFALERALGKPGDYLGCECCSPTSPRPGRSQRNPPAVFATYILTLQPPPRSRNNNQCPRPLRCVLISTLSLLIHRPSSHRRR